MALTEDDEITSSESMLNLTEVARRRDHLRPFRVADRRQDANAPALAAFAYEANARTYIDEQVDSLRPFLIVDEYSDETEELTALRKLATELALLGGNRAVAVSEDYLMTYLRDELEDLYGSGAVNTLDNYVDWDRYRDDRANEMTRTEYRDGVFYLIR